ncbi:hypothetical protein [Haloarcula sp. Atlit-120R]|uniref:hypothetical protein n=1 Tax=Haloarcula sp. Atlit-120R TaxID=2282135 RepID=UPI000EF21CA1|nr:hypothetical protein [Haloarcula sp. Atlit-120R]RLM32655.1 hypothetical protein DVK01_20500 [Haloarcula sp. Atlit-120R]
MSETEEIPPPKSEEELNQIPNLSESDRVHVETHGDWDADRTLTVEQVDADPERTDNLSITSQDSQVVLSGYGTEYRLTIDRSWTNAWQRVTLSWPSRPEGISVTDIGVIDS